MANLADDGAIGLRLPLGILGEPPIHQVTHEFRECLPMS
jgi:hypothetical protein